MSIKYLINFSYFNYYTLIPKKIRNLINKLYFCYLLKYSAALCFHELKNLKNKYAYDQIIIRLLIMVSYCLWISFNASIIYWPT